MSGRHRSETAPDTSGPMDPATLAAHLAVSPLDRPAAEAIWQALRTLSRRTT
jgi:hypothetical protein